MNIFATINITAAKYQNLIFYIIPTADQERLFGSQIVSVTFIGPIRLNSNPLNQGYIGASRGKKSLKLQIRLASKKLIQFAGAEVACFVLSLRRHSAK